MERTESETSLDQFLRGWKDEILAKMSKVEINEKEQDSAVNHGTKLNAFVLFKEAELNEQ